MEHTTNPFIMVNSFRIVGNNYQGICCFGPTHTTHISTFEDFYYIAIFYDLANFQTGLKHIITT